MIGLALSLTPVYALGHHSFAAEYDAGKPVKLKGILTEIDWRNPHIYFFLDVKDDSGKIVKWKLEGYPPNMLVRRGGSRKDFLSRIGQDVTVTGWQARDGSNLAHSRVFTFSDGSTFESGPAAGTGGPGGAPGGAPAGNRVE